MNDCCTSSSPRNKAATSASETLPSYTVRPGVTFPDWSAVTSPAVRDALLAMASNHVFDLWSGYDSATDLIRVALRCFSSTPNMDAPRPSARLPSARGWRRRPFGRCSKSSAGATCSFSTASGLSAPIPSLTATPATA